MSEQVQLNSPGQSSQSGKGGFNLFADLQSLRKKAKMNKNQNQDNKDQIPPIDMKTIEPDSKNNITFERPSTSPSKAKSPEDQKNQVLRSAFQQGLSKLYKTDTFDLAMNELKTLIANNNNSSSLRIFLSSLAEYKKIPTPTAQECEVSLFGYIASQYKDNLIDPLDKNPGVLKTAYRLIESIQSYFKVSAPNVARACSFSLQQIYFNCLIGEDPNNKCLALYEPLSIIISGGTDRVSQGTAGLCLCELLLGIVQAKDSEFLEEVRKRYIPTFLKLNYENAEIIRAMGITLDNTDIRLSGGKIHNILEKLMKHSQTKSQIYQIKLEAATALKIIGSKLLLVAESFIGNLHEEVIESLRQLSKDRLIKVQNTSNEALKVWYKLKEELERIETKKKKRDIVEFSPDDIIKLRTGLDVNEAANEDATKLAENIQAITEKKLDKQDHEIGSSNVYVMDRYKKILKKKSGVGGGFVVLDKDRMVSPDNKKTEHRQKSNIKDQIAKAMEQKNQKAQGDKFDSEVYYPGKKSAVVSNFEVDIDDMSANEQLPETHLSRPNSQPVAKNNLVSPTAVDNFEKVGYSENFQAAGMNDRNFEAILESKMYEAAKRAVEDSKKERQRELTNQLFDLQNKGFIKNIPKNEGPLQSVESANKGDNIFSTAKKDLLQRHGSAGAFQDPNEKSRLNDPFGETQKTLNIHEPRFGETNAFSENIDEAKRSTYQGFYQPPPSGAKSALSSKGFDQSGSRSQKDFIIRQSFNKRPNSGKSNAFVNKSYNQVTTSEDLDDTINYELEEVADFEELSTGRAMTKKTAPSSSEGTTNIWEMALKNLEQGDMQKAYELVLASGDDTYLLRLLMRTGPVIEQLNRKTAVALTNRTTQLMASNFQDNLFTDFIQEGFDLDLIDSLPVGDQNDLLQELYDVSGKDHEKAKQASQLYSILLNKLNSGD